jgi:hypothetical protein
LAFRFLIKFIFAQTYNMGFGAIRADGSRVSTFVFQFGFCSGWTNFVGL